MRIHIKELSFEVIIGILEFERMHNQQVIVNMDIEYKFDKDNFIDYSIIALRVEEMMLENQYQLIEDALNDINNDIYSKYSNLITNIKIEIIKPNIIDNCIVSVSNSWDYRGDNNEA
ncbi:Dihydroneopterin aldolase [hydrothermal vent metagenome]|uniref:Dihydroneopterin aldolase n=1 Tax=hydrothermal vent metagenome TaxID=652676 RepID=A0A1W1ELJ9_9ZZZZ